jgi:hypothetical protein
MEEIRPPIEARTLADGEGTTPAGGGSPPRESDFDERRGKDPTDKISALTEVEGAIWMTNCWSPATGTTAMAGGGCAMARGAKVSPRARRARPRLMIAGGILLIGWMMAEG